MARGGYRPGSGPRKGTRYKSRSSEDAPQDELTSEQQENIKIMLKFGERLADGGKLTRTEIKQLEEMNFGELTRAAKKRLLESFK